MTKNHATDADNVTSRFDYQDFFVNAPTYFSEQTSDERRLKDIFVSGRAAFTAHCAICKRETVFQNINKTLDSNPNVYFYLVHGDHIISFLCQLCKIHHICFAVRVTSNSKKIENGVQPFSLGIIEKYGQKPSYADIHKEELKKYRKIISDIDAREIQRAKGLASVGVNVGAFVYLRRVFERLIENVHENLAEKERKKDFHNLPMERKIEELRGFLPSFIYDNRRIYGILSKGIHELSEEKCGSLYEIVHDSILMILDEVLANKVREEKLITLGKAISSVDLSD